MALIISIETATKVCSVALHADARLVATQSLHAEKSHSESLLCTIEHLLAISPYTKEDLTAIAVSSGPGSYTGLRIGTSTAKGLCYALEIPLIAVNTLEAMVHGMQPYNTAQALLCPMLDARRMEVYCLLTDFQGHILDPVHPRLIDQPGCKITISSFLVMVLKSVSLFWSTTVMHCLSTTSILRPTI
jgi:tRNA threonylcarbamoyladenosine biosynthesis protein TsaB